jgi:hypothetical protein
MEGADGNNRSFNAKYIVNCFYLFIYLFLQGLDVTLYFIFFFFINVLTFLELAIKE